ncbi:ABC transporter substrate-binding protein [Kushneria marisflavi]|uniref:Quaternary ammonium transporter n=1 Tax=Kushneria marisflavi TaxID=157779 RepID=A0A240UUP0_9GAMM|nr:ABC transporter substrate-binding protein [Kushneria marisflavi]ART64772.1 quaternary ammonium transporter [Kushneria marisflavi]RKD85520.1 osmoprotectant transport system substrate-binding protein [Kushneria marisflavi]
MKGTMNMSRGWKLGLGALALAALAGCSGGDEDSADNNAAQNDDSDQATVTIGSTNFPEQLILANIYADVLKNDGVNVNTRLNLGSREVVFPALTNGEIDLLPEYSGALMTYLDQDEAHADARSNDDVMAALRSILPDGIEALEASPAEDRDALVVTRETADQYNLKTFSDLAPVSGELTLGGPPETRTRDVGIPGLKRVYNIEFANFRSLDAGGPLTRGALANGDIDVARMFSSQGAIAENDWVALKDDKNLEPAQNIVAVGRSEALNDEIRASLNRVSETLTTEDLQAMNHRVEIDKADPAQVASQWVDEHMNSDQQSTN